MHRLSTSLPYLLTRLGVRMGDLFAQAVRKEGMSLQTYRVLAALVEAGRPLRLGELATCVSAEVSTLSRFVAAMHRKGLLNRERPEHDQRSLQVSLTAQGEALAARFMPIAAHYEEVATGRLMPGEVDALRARLIDLYDNLDLLAEEVTNGAVDRMLDTPAPRARPPRRPPVLKTSGRRIAR